MFKQLIELASELGLLDGPAEQIVDSTRMLGGAAVQDTAVLVRTAVDRLIDAVARHGPSTLAMSFARRCGLSTRARARSPTVTGLIATCGCGF